MQRLGRAVALVEAFALHQVVHRRTVFVEDLADEFHRDAGLRFAIVRGHGLAGDVAGILAPEKDELAHLDALLERDPDRPIPMPLGPAQRAWHTCAVDAAHRPTLL